MGLLTACKSEVDSCSPTELLQPWQGRPDWTVYLCRSAETWLAAAALEFSSPVDSHYQQ